MAASSPIVELTSVDKFYGSGRKRFHALRSVSFDVANGEFLAIVGPSGSGKTTCLNIMGCLDTPSAGVCRLAEQETGALSPAERALVRRDLVGFVFQNFNLIESMSACRNVELPLVYRGVPAGKRALVAAAALDAVGLSGRGHDRPGELSGGQQQRVSIARAIVARPRLLIADEPTGALDSVNGAAILRLLRQLNRELGVTVVLVTHDQALARQADRQITFADGCLVADTPTGGPISDAA